MAWKNLLSSMLFFFFSSLDFDLGQSKQPFYEGEKGARMISLSLPFSLTHTHNHLISFWISLQLIFMGTILTIVWI